MNSTMKAGNLERIKFNFNFKSNNILERNK
jgi:hypothetical protein